MRFSTMLPRGAKEKSRQANLKAKKYKTNSANITASSSFNEAIAFSVSIYFILNSDIHEPQTHKRCEETQIPL